MSNEVLITLGGDFNEGVYKTLKKVIHNIANNKMKTNRQLDIEDLKQEAWVRILETIQKNKNNGKELEIGYLIRVAQTSILAYCQKEAVIKNNSHDYANEVMNLYESDEHNNYSSLKSRFEYLIECNRFKSNIEEEITLKVSLETLLENLTDERVKNMILIRYVKEFDGKSEKILSMYNEFYNSCSEDRKKILDNMSKYTNNSGFKAIGLRATDNITTKIRNDIREVLAPLY